MTEGPTLLTMNDEGSHNIIASDTGTEEVNSETEEVKDNNNVMHMEDTSSYIVKKRRPSLI